MTHQTKPGQDYSGQNLSGRSFRGQNLRGAVFRNADLRGVDFREADVTGADFSGARMGKTWRGRALGLPVQFLLGIFLGLLVLLGVGSTNGLIVEPLAKLVTTEASTNVALNYWALLTWMGLQIGFVWAAQRGRLENFFMGLGVLSVPFWVGIFLGNFAETGVLSGTEVGYPVGYFAGAKASGMATGAVLAVVLVVVVAVAWTLAVASAGGLASVCASILVLIGVLSVIYGRGVTFNRDKQIAAETLVLADVITSLVSWWLTRQALKNEIIELDWLRRWGLRFRCFGGTDFRDAELTGANFSNSRLDFVRYAGATLNRTHWLNAKNLHLAYTYGTVLQAKPIRELLTTGHTQHKDFHGKDLHGLDFSGMNLAEADFTDSDLTGASFNGADLTAAKFTRAVLLGVDLSNARLTGASIGHWNIDKFTRFDGVDCEYVYLDEECKERHPATGQFRPGEFAKLYQEIAHTVDFLIENSTQMEALLRTLEKLRASYDDEDIAQVQKVERKGEAYKVSVAVPAEMEEILRKEIRQEFAQQLLESQSHVKLLQNDHQHLQRERDNLKEMLVLSLSRPINVNATAEANAVNDNSRKIENASISNSAVNLGDHAEVNNTTQIGSQLSEIEPLLEQLRGLINQSTELPEVLKQDALEKVETLSLAAAKPEAEAKSAAAGALEALKTTAKLATGISSVVLALSKLFGF